MRAFRIAYDGTTYYGYQRQPDVPTVEDAIFDALRRLEVLEVDAHRPPGYAAAGRTDAGVSAVCQTVAFEAPDWLTPRALNAELPEDVRAWAAAEAPEEFHATHHATRREYTYHLYAPSRPITGSSADPVDGGSFHGASLHDAPFDDARFHDALDALSGPHDFHNLTPDDRNTERSPTLEATRDGAFLVVTVSAGGFPRELVRRLVSLAADVGRGTEPLEKIDRVFDAEPLPGHEGVAPAPAEALVLTHVEYSHPEFGLEFDPDEAETGSASAVFEGRRVERLTGARVSRQLRDGVR